MDTKLVFDGGIAKFDFNYNGMKIEVIDFSKEIPQFSLAPQDIV